MISVAALKALAAAGATADMIVAAMEVELAADEERKAKNQDRMRAVRARARTLEHVQEPESALSMLPSSESQKPKEEKKERAKRERGHVCPDELRPAEVHFEAGQRQNVPRNRVEACCEAMKSWSKSNSHRAIARKVDWHAALFGWIERESERTGKSHGNTISLADAFAGHRRDLANLTGEGGDFEESPSMLDITPASVRGG